MKPKTVVTSRSLIEALSASFTDALRVPEGTAEPAALLWADTDGQWKSLIPRLRSELPNLYSLGSYDPSARTGPVIWLKCVVERAAPPAGTIPILYLQGISRQELRAGGECRTEYQPLIELQYRGRPWHQPNGRDWSVEAFLASADALDLDIAQDARTREAMLRALPLLADTPLDSLRGRRLEADDFDRLAVSDPIRDLLRWMSDPEGFEKATGAANWQSFRSIARSEFGFDPDDGVDSAAKLLVKGGGRWDHVWNRFCEAPKVYRGISVVMRQPAANPGTLAFEASRRPNLNDEAEERLRSDLELATDLPPGRACDKILELENEHGLRRSWVWAQLGDSVYAAALAPLSRLAALAKASIAGPSVAILIERYVVEGWQCDRAALDALACARGRTDGSVISKIVRALYLPWLDASARNFQEALLREAGLRPLSIPGMNTEKDTCLFFADGLRFDLGWVLQAKLEARGFRVRLEHRLAPLPTVTATAKPLATPIHTELEGADTADDFAPVFKSTRRSASAQRLREAMEQKGVQVLDSDDIHSAGSDEVGGWTETGRLDELGHNLGAELVAHIEPQLEKIADRVIQLLDGGWRKVRVVTDHGWLLLPGGLPKVDLPSYLTATKWGRCAVITANANPTVPIFPWHWNPIVRIGCPPGTACFVAGTEYSHGGVSLQECVVPELVVERPHAGTEARIESVQWRGMRCRISVKSNDPTVRVDLRLNWKQPATSVVAAIKEVGNDGEVSLAVTDDSHEGAAATVVLLDSSEKVLEHRPTSIGEM